MRWILLYVLLLFHFESFAQSENVKYEIYIKCCMGTVMPNSSSFPFQSCKDSNLVGRVNQAFVILPDTGKYAFWKIGGMDGDTIIQEFKEYRTYRDTFAVVPEVSESIVFNKKGKQIRSVWECNGCIMDGYLFYKDKNGRMEWEGMFRNGVDLWYKVYHEDELIYHSKRNFFGKRRVVLDELWKIWWRKDKEKIEDFLREKRK